MRAQADEVQSRSFQWVLVRSMAVALVALLVAALAPLSPAQADSHMPWDQEGSSWQGTLTTSLHQKFHYPQAPQGQTLDETVTYTDLSPLGSSADSSHTARIVASGTIEDWYWCADSGAFQKNLVTTWSIDRPGQLAWWSYRDVLGFDTNDEGQTFFAPWRVGGIGTTTQHFCGQPSTSSNEDYNGIQSHGFYGGASTGFATKPLVDEDPDPLRLVGTTSWTLSDPPLSESHPSQLQEYSFTVTYDLRLVDNSTCRPVNTSYLARFASELNPDVLRYSWNDLEFCYGPEGVRVISTGTQEGALVDSGALSGALSFFGQKFEYAGSSPVTTTKQSDGSIEAKVTGRFKFCTQIPIAGPIVSKGIKKVLDIVPRWIRTKLVNWGVKRIFNSSVIPNSLKIKILRRGYKAVLNNIDNLSAAERSALLELFDTVIGKASDDIAGLVLGDGVCFVTWRPEIVARLMPGGSYDTFAQGPTGPFSVVKDF